MKKSLIIFAMLLTITAIISCERTALDLGAPLAAGKTSSIQKGEPVTFSFESKDGIDHIEWQVTPASKVDITSMGKTARIKFGEAGVYVVSATDKINISRTTVTVDTTTYFPKDTTNRADTTRTQIPKDTVKTTEPDIPVVNPKDTTKVVRPDTVGTHNIYHDLKNATFTLTPMIVDTLSTAGLGFRIESDNLYPCTNSYLGFNHFFKNSQTKISRLNLYNVVQPGARYCQGGNAKVTANTFIYPLSEGDNQIEITMNGHVYAGVIHKNQKTFSILWPDTSVIKFTILTLTK